MRAVLASVLVMVYAALPAEASVPAFNALGITASLTVSADQLSYTNDTVCTLACGGLTDVYGVRIVVINGVTYQHPTEQAQLALNLLNSYRLNHDPRYLARAILNAQRLVDDRIPSGAAWFFPYGFDFAVYGDAALTLHAPWYSALAQAQALSAFVRLSNLTGDPAWRAAADATFASLLVVPSTDQPWVSWIDGDGYLWMEEYPRLPVDVSERVLNGTIFAIFGIYDYLRLTNDPDAAALFDGEVATVEHYFPQWRVAGHPAYYSLGHLIQNAHYHPVVVAEFRCLAKLTGRHEESSMAYWLYQDYPTTRFQLCGDY
jgi:D-glucuronyl C5-epimerase C-terminus